MGQGVIQKPGMTMENRTNKMHGAESENGTWEIPNTGGTLVGWSFKRISLILFAEKNERENSEIVICFNYSCGR